LCNEIVGIFPECVGLLSAVKSKSLLDIFDWSHIKLVGFFKKVTLLIEEIEISDIEDGIFVSDIDFWVICIIVIENAHGPINRE
jgi:hypothetical protein